MLVKRGVSMQINNDWKIESDELNIILSERSIISTGKNEGEEQWKVKGYYSNIKNAHDAMIDKEIKGTGLTDLETVIRKIDELKASFKER
jgi:hypothetical protein